MKVKDMTQVARREREKIDLREVHRVQGSTIVRRQLLGQRLSSRREQRCHRQVRQGSGGAGEGRHV